MGTYVNSGYESFQGALQSEIYIDKTSMIKELNLLIGTSQNCLCVSRPRRFGKSTAVEMLVAYYGRGYDSKKIFEGLNISKDRSFEKYLNQYQVIRVDMNDFLFRLDPESGEQVSSCKAVALFQSEIIRELEEYFPDVEINTKIDLPVALTNINKATGERFIIIVDEWDALFREKKMDVEAQKKYIQLFRGLFKNANSRKFLAMGYITGILPIKKYGTESALNNFHEYTMVTPGRLAEYVGFTEEEVIGLCNRYDMDFEIAKLWYDGYSFRKIKHLYNPSAIVNAMLDGEFNNYWTRTETYESLKNYISMNFDGLKDSVVKMLAGERCKVNTGKFQNDMTNLESRDDIITLLIHLGYLAYDADTKEAYIPNEEVRDEFKNAVEGANWKDVVKAISESENLLRDTLCMDGEAVAKRIDEIHMVHTSILSYNDENSLSCVIALAYYCAIKDYIMVRELLTGKGFADIVFLPRHHTDKPAMVVELKFNKSAESAINQIKDKKYTKSLESYKGNLLLVGINYDEKYKKHQCIIEKERKE